MKKLLFVFLALFWASVASAQFADQRQYSGVSTGSANAQAVAIPNYALNIGVVVRFQASFTNTGAMTLNVNSTSAVPVEKQSPTGLFALAGGEVVSGQIVEVIFDGAQFELVSPTPFGQSGQVTAIAGAATTDLGTVQSRFADITGSATISSFGSSASISFPTYQIYFGGASTLVNSNTLRVPGGSNMVTAAGDFATALFEGGGTWAILNYTSAGNTIPGIPGEIRTFAMLACPTNWHAADGSAVSRTADAGLYQQIGVTYGSGDGSTTFNLPDGRGYFYRQVDNGAGRDPGRGMGTTQTNQVGQASGPIAATSSSSSTTIVSAPSASSTTTVSAPSATSTSIFSSGATVSSVLIFSSGSSTIAPGSNFTTGSAQVAGTVTTTTTVSAPSASTTTTTTTAGTTTTNSGNTDNRPINIAFQNCIKL